MQQPYQIAGTETQTIAESQARVLRNTYLLLAISMLPTIAGAALGVNMGFHLFRMIGSPIAFALIYLGVAWGLMWGIGKTKDSAMGVALLLVFTFFMGLMLAPILTLALNLDNGWQLIAAAAGGTGAIFFTLASIATVTKKDFSFMGKFLMVGLFVTLLAMLVSWFVDIPALYLAISAVCVGLFSMYILYDISRIIHGGETNYIMAALSIYIDIYNIFIHLLRILIALSGNDSD